MSFRQQLFMKNLYSSLICAYLELLSASVFMSSVEGRDGSPSGPLRRAQTGWGRVRVSLSPLCWGDPLQRGTTNAHSSGSSSHILLLSINLILPHLSPSSSTPLSWSFSQSSSRSSGCSSQPAVDFWTFVGRRVRANALAVAPSARGAGALSFPINLQDVCGSLWQPAADGNTLLQFIH